VVPDNSSNGFVQSLDGHADREAIRIANIEFPIGTPVWDGRGNLVSLPLWTGEANLIESSKEWMPHGARAWDVAPDGGEGYELADGASADGRSAYLIDETGTMVRQRIDDGRLTGTFPDPSGDQEGEGRASSASISPSGRLVAISYEDGVRVERLPHRELISRVPGSDSSRVAFAGDRLLLLDDRGQLQIWDAEGKEREGVIANAGGGWLAGSPDGRLAALSNPEEGTVRLFDLELDAEIAAFKTPVPISLLKTGIAFSSQGPALIAASETLSEDKGVLVERNLSDASLVNAACTAAGSELTPGQWRSFIGTTPPGNLSCR
jgi:WD40 repeat protein